MLLRTVEDAGPYIFIGRPSADTYRPTSIILHFAFCIYHSPPFHVLPNLPLFFGEEAFFVRFSRHFSHILCHLIGDFLEGGYTYKRRGIC